MNNIFETTHKNWLLEESGYDASRNGHYETLFTLSNGYIGIRGVKDFCGSFFRKGTFFAGVFDKSEARVVELVNCPEFFTYDIFIGSERMDIDKLKVISYKRVLDMQRGVLTTGTELECLDGKRFELLSTKFVSIANKYLTAFSVNIKCINFSDNIRITSIIDGNTTNTDFQSAQSINHYKVSDITLTDNKAAALKAYTNDENIEMVFTSYITFPAGEKISIETSNDKNTILQSAAFYAEQGKNYTIQKLVFSENRAGKEEISERCNLFGYIKNEANKPFAQHLKDHVGIMKEKWEISDIVIEGDDRAQIAIRYNIFNLLMLGADLEGNTNLGAKGLHGEGYKGHVFWDTEIFMLPFYVYNDTEAARKLLMYRYNRLQAAKENAKASGFRGAQFPWESADSGREVTPKTIYLPDGTPIRCWTGDEEIHVTGDVAFALYEYYRITGDKEFFFEYGAEVILETAKYWESRLQYNSQKDKYEINTVIGPDEFHVHVNNNFYTNYLARWNLYIAFEILEQLKKFYPDRYESLKLKTDLSEEIVKAWTEKADKIAILRTEGVVEQFEGFFRLKDCPVIEHKPNGMPIFAPQFKTELDFEEYQLIKQADVVMIMHLFNHEFSHEQKRLNYEYYEKRTTHISSLSPSIYCLMGIDINNTGMAYKYFDIAANTDIDDNQENTKHGIHAASLGGTWQAAIFGFGGFRIKDGMIHLSPWLPDTWNGLEYKVHWQNRVVEVKIDKSFISIKINDTNVSSFNLIVNESAYLIEANVETKINLF